MQPQTEEGQRIVACLKCRINGAADIGIVANAIISMFDDMNRVLVPIIGAMGVAALYRRSLLLSMNADALLARPYESLVLAMDLAHFKSLLTKQTSINAICFGEALLKTTYALLATLIGPSLSTRLLYSVWENSPSAPSVQDKLP